MDFEEWVEVYKKIIGWELKLEISQDEGMNQVLKMQKDEANQVFSKFIERNYLDWLNGRSNTKACSVAQPGQGEGLSLAILMTSRCL